MKKKSYPRLLRKFCECGNVAGTNRVGGGNICDRCWVLDGSRNKDERSLSKAIKDREAEALRVSASHCARVFIGRIENT